MKYTTSDRNYQTWELKILRPQVFVRLVKLRG